MLMLYPHEIKVSEETWEKVLDKTQGANKIALNKQKHTHTSLFNIFTLKTSQTTTSFC